MKGFFRWFKKEAKMKRWFILIIIGIIMACYGMMKLLVEKRIVFSELPKIVASFIFGFTIIIISIVFIQKRTLEILVQKSDTRQDAKDGEVKSLIFNKKVYDQGPNIVVIGGGSGLSSVLKGLKKYTNNITAIVTVSDYGKKASDSRKMLETLPLEDIRDSLIALAENEDVMQGILNYKFTSGKLKELCFGDIYLLAMKELYGDFPLSIEQSKNVLNISGRVLPVTLGEINICAELEDGTVVENKDKIPDVVANKVSKINRIYITPSNCTPAPGVIEAIQSADAIIIGPGSLYTNVIPNLLVKGVARAIKENKGFKIYISNIMTEPGQTDDYKLSDHIRAIHEHAGKGVIDYCIYDTGEVVPEFVRKYNKEGKDIVEQDVQNAKEEGVKLIQRNLSYIDGDHIRHNPDGIASSIIELICEDMKFRDMQNDTQYLMLNSKLKDTKKKLKSTEKVKNKVKNTYKPQHGKRTSKFAEKYKERMESIKESDEKALRKKHEKMADRSKKKTRTSTNLEKSVDSITDLNLNTDSSSRLNSIISSSNLKLETERKTAPRTRKTTSTSTKSAPKTVSRTTKVTSAKSDTGKNSVSKKTSK